MRENYLPPLTIENANVLPGNFMNFSGKKTKFKPEGYRFFHIGLDPEDARRMRDDGWNVKQTRDREVDGEVEAGMYYIEVAVSFSNKPPTVFMYSNGSPTRLKEDMIDLLEQTEIITWDVTLSPYHWEMESGSSGVKAYLKELHATCVPSVLGEKYKEFHQGV